METIWLSVSPKKHKLNANDKWIYHFDDTFYFVVHYAKYWRGYKWVEGKFSTDKQ